MPYDLLDAIERAAIRDKRGPLEVFELMSAAFPQHAAPQLVTWIERFFRLFTRNQWKRERWLEQFEQKGFAVWLAALRRFMAQNTKP